MRTTRYLATGGTVVLLLVQVVEEWTAVLICRRRDDRKRNNESSWSVVIARQTMAHPDGDDDNDVPGSSPSVCSSHFGLFVAICWLCLTVGYGFWSPPVRGLAVGLSHFGHGFVAFGHSAVQLCQQNLCRPSFL
jgi:hypothetical protein